MEKKCKCCWIVLQIEEFSKDKYAKDSHKSKCKRCCSIINKEWRVLNKEVVNNKARENYCNNREKNIEYSRIYKEKNKERVLEYRKEYTKKYNQRENVKLRYRITSSLRRKIIRETWDWSVSVESVISTLEKQLYKCNICWIDLKTIKLELANWKIIDWKHIDHIVPLSKGWTHTIWNIQWLCWMCNLKKWDRL